MCLIAYVDLYYIISVVWCEKRSVVLHTLKANNWSTTISILLPHMSLWRIWGNNRGAYEILMIMTFLCSKNIVCSSFYNICHLIFKRKLFLLGIHLTSDSKISKQCYETGSTLHFACFFLESICLLYLSQMLRQSVAVFHCLCNRSGSTLYLSHLLQAPGRCPRRRPPHR